MQADRFHAAKLDDLLALPSETPIVLSIDLDEAVQRNDRSMRVEQLLDTGTPAPRPAPAQIEGTPGLRLCAAKAKPHGSFGVVGDVYLSEAAWAVPSELPFALRAPWMSPRG